MPAEGTCDVGAGVIAKYHFGPGVAIGNIDPMIEGTSDIMIMSDGE